jgi:hypothetical protein
MKILIVYKYINKNPILPLSSNDIILHIDNKINLINNKYDKYDKQLQLMEEGKLKQYNINKLN